MLEYFRDVPLAYQATIEIVVLIIGLAIALPGGRKWGWLLCAASVAGMLMTMKMKGLFDIG